MLRKYRNLWIALGALIILSPLGLIASGTAFGEWGVDRLSENTGFIPVGLQQMAALWQHAPLADYGLAGFSHNVLQSSIGYVFSAVVGVLLIVGLMFLLGKMVKE